MALALLPVPLPTLRRAVAGIALVTAPELREEADRVATEVEEAEGFAGHRVHVAQVGRARQVEMVFHVPAGLPARPLEDWDRVRPGVAERLGRGEPDSWVTVSFTTRLLVRPAGPGPAPTRNCQGSSVCSNYAARAGGSGRTGGDAAGS